MGDRARRIGRALGVPVLALLPGVALGVYVRHPSLAFLPYFTLVPWVVLYSDDRRPRAALWPYALGAWFAWVVLYPGSYGYGWFTPPFLGIVCFWTWLPFAPMLRRIHRRFGLPRTLVVPVLWVAVEWFRSEFTIGHFDLYRLGATQARFTTLVQIADITGVYGVTFLVAAVNGLVADLLFAVRDARRAPGGGRAWRRLALSGAALGVLFVATGVYGVIRLRGLRFEDGPRLAVVQPNVRHTIRNVRGVHLTELLMTEETVPAGVADVIVWPENAIMDDIRRGGPYRDDLRWLAGRKRARLLVGALNYPPDHPGHTTNSAFLVDLDGTILGRYDKIVLFPWSEHVPLDDTLERLSPRLFRMHRALARKAWGFLASGVRGSEMHLLRLPWNGGVLPFGALICLENAYPPVPALAARRGARFLVNITSEGDVGGPVQEQMLRMCILRAVENRLAYARAGNTGISGFIDPEGRVTKVLVGERGGTIDDAGVAIERIALSGGGPTVYARSADAFAKACVALAVLLYLAAWIPAARGGRRAAGIALLALLAAGCVIEPAVGDDPGDATAALERGKALYETGHPAEALEALGEACGDPAACHEAMKYAAESFLAIEQPESGVEFFRTVAERHPVLAAEAGGYRGYMLERSLRLRQAERVYLESLEREPSARVYELLGSLRLRMDDVDGAIETYRRGVDLAPANTRLRYLLGNALRVGGALDEAETALHSVLADDPTYSRAWTRLGALYVAKGEPAAATAALRRAVEIDPRDVEAYFELARVAVRAGDLAEAHRLLGVIQGLEEALGRGPRQED